MAWIIYRSVCRGNADVAVLEIAWGPFKNRKVCHRELKRHSERHFEIDDVSGRCGVYVGQKRIIDQERVGARCGQIMTTSHTCTVLSQDALLFEPCGSEKDNTDDRNDASPLHLSSCSCSYLLNN